MGKINFLISTAAIFAVVLWMVLLLTNNVHTKSTIYSVIGIIAVFAIYILYQLKLILPWKSKNFFLLLFILFVSDKISVASSNELQKHNSNNEYLIGNWKGMVNAGPMNFTLVFKFIKTETGSVVGTLDIIEQNTSGLPVDDILMRNDSLFLSLSKINRKYAGKINSDKNKIEGVYIRSGAPSLSLNLTKVETVAALKRPQTPQPPYPYREEQVEFTNKSDNVTLAGNLTIPEGKGVFPAIILISGSGAQDRDETIFEHRPFRVLADYFTRNGFAVLRFDDRGVGGSSGDHLAATTKTNAEDIQSALDLLCSREEIKKREIVLIGHSEGTVIASLVASTNPAVSGIVLLGAPGLKIEENLYLQNALIRKADGANDAVIEQMNSIQKMIFSVIIKEDNDSIAKVKLRDIYSSNRYQSLPPDQKKSIDGRINNLLTPYFRDIIKCDPSQVISKVKCRALIITGEKDLQCPPDQNLPVIEKALNLAENNNFRIVKLTGLNHMLQTCKTGALSEYSAIEETINPQVLNTILEWLVKGE
jgi:pimeloyl-ACP methyl ester carboxylesterase